MIRNSVTFDCNLNKSVRGESPIDISIIICNEGKYAFLKLGEWCFRLYAYKRDFGEVATKLNIFKLDTFKTKYVGFENKPFEWAEGYSNVESLYLDFAYISEENEGIYGFVITTMSKKYELVVGNPDNYILECEAMTFDSNRGVLYYNLGGNKHEIEGCRYDDIPRLLIFGDKEGSGCALYCK